MDKIKVTDLVSVIKGIGAKTEQDFNKIGIFTVNDLLHYYPRNYDVFENPIYIQSIEEGKMVAIEASMIGSVTMKQMRNLKILSCTVKDCSGSIQLTWFNMPFLKNQLKLGYHFIFRGKVIRKQGLIVIEQPKIYRREEYRQLMNVFQPVYALTAGITSHTISKAVRFALEHLDLSYDYLPKSIMKKNQLIGYKNAITEIHFPQKQDLLLEARKRLIYDEFFQFILTLQFLKDRKNILHNHFNYKLREESNEFIQGLPFRLTNAQKKVWEEIARDLCSNRTMNRLVQGDVGSGKTIVAALALMLTVLNGYQGALMVPTEVLAQQHYESLSTMFVKYNIRVISLVGSMTASEKRKAYLQIENHEVDLIIGTHALIQEKVCFNKLALVVTDEQHRFGVKQRERLFGKGEHPHVLVMSATPIPRTLAIILYGDLDISIVDELPSNRLPIKNCVVDTNYRPKAYQFIENQVLEGRQAYIICPMVEESESIEAENVIEYTDRLKEEFMGRVVVEYLHGKMNAKEKNKQMQRFASGEIQVLISTTVVEVGVNVPNATVMMIENAERFGLAQLHQLRGRVGRGKHQSYCILMSGSTGKETKERLEILNRSNDGFYIAGEDLKLRGPGDMFGIRQSGEMEFRLGDIYSDSALLKSASDAVKEMSAEEQKILIAQNKELEIKISRFDMGTI